MKRLRGPMTIIAWIVVLALPAIAGPPDDRLGTCEQVPSPEPVSERAVPVAMAGVQVAVDPATGRLVQPTPEQIRELTTALLGESGARKTFLPSVVRPDGTRMRALDPSYMHYSVARIDADGRLSRSCEDRPVEGPPAVASDPAAPSPQPRGPKDR